LAVGTLWSAEAIDSGYLNKVSDYFDVSIENVNSIAATDIAIEEVPTVFFTEFFPLQREEGFTVT
jgi:hypothetical protein